MDRVLVAYRKGQARRWILLSPQDKQRFFEDLVAASAGLKIVGDRVMRGDSVMPIPEKSEN